MLALARTIVWREAAAESAESAVRSRWPPAADRLQALPGNPAGQRRPRADQRRLVVRRARGGWQCQAVPHGRPASANPTRPRHGPLDRRDRRAAVITAIAVTFVDIVARWGAAGMSELPAQRVRQRCRFVDDEP